MRPLFVVLFALLAGCAADAPYKNCSRTDICGGGDTPLCLATTSPSRVTAQFCTRRCTTPAATAVAADECPANSACAPINGDGPYCLLHCTADADCPFTNGVCLVTAESLGARVCTVRP